MPREEAPSRGDNGRETVRVGDKTRAGGAEGDGESDSGL